jgi:hypothetical protein
MPFLEYRQSLLAVSRSGVRQVIANLLRILMPFLEYRQSLLVVCKSGDRQVITNFYTKISSVLLRILLRRLFVAQCHLALGISEERRIRSRIQLKNVGCIRGWHAAGNHPEVLHVIALPSYL